MTLIDCALPTNAVTLTDWAVGASLIARTVMVNVCVGLASTPPSRVPPSSTAPTAIVAVPLALSAGVKVNVPSAATAGPAANRPGFVFDTTWKDSTCPASFAGPTDIPVAHPGTDCGP